MDRVSVLLLRGTNTIVIRKEPDSNVFLTTPDSFILSKEILLQIVDRLCELEIIKQEREVGG